VPDLIPLDRLSAEGKLRKSTILKNIAKHITTPGYHHQEVVNPQLMKLMLGQA
jgi:hypothetical protein